MIWYNKLPIYQELEQGLQVNSFGWIGSVHKSVRQNHNRLTVFLLIYAFIAILFISELNSYGAGQQLNFVCVFL